MLNAVKSVTPMARNTEFEGDRNGWHIRLSLRVGTVEVWQLWNGDSPESSPTLKSVVVQWMQEEIQRKR